MEQKEFKPGVAISGMDAAFSQEREEENLREENVEEVECDTEEDMELFRAHEEDFIQGLINAAGYHQEEEQRIEIIRDKKLLFAFRIRPLSEEEYERCKKKHTKYVRNKRFGMMTPQETDAVKYRASLIYQATVLEDREKLWDNRSVWSAMKGMGLPVMNGLDVIEYSLKAGEKDKVLEAIDNLSGYAETNLEEVIKN